MSQPISAGEAVGGTLLFLLVVSITIGGTYAIGYSNGYFAGTESVSERHDKLLIEKGLGRYKDGKFEWKETVNHVTGER